MRTISEQTVGETDEAWSSQMTELLSRDDSVDFEGRGRLARTDTAPNGSPAPRARAIGGTSMAATGTVAIPISTESFRLRCKRSNSPGNALKIVGLLKTVGVPNRMLYVRQFQQNGSFWTRPINHLQILEQARHLYREQIVCVHPDKAGGNLERTIHLNHTWREIKRRFKTHGHVL